MELESIPYAVVGLAACPREREQAYRSTCGCKQHDESGQEAAREDTGVLHA